MKIVYNLDIIFYMFKFYRILGSKSHTKSRIAQRKDYERAILDEVWLDIRNILYLLYFLILFQLVEKILVLIRNKYNKIIMLCCTYSFLQ